MRVEPEQSLPSLGLEVLDVVGLVEDHVMPPPSPEYLLVLEDHLIGGDADIPHVVVRPALPFSLALLLVAVVSKDLEARAPFLELHLPVQHDAGRDDHQMRTPDFMVACEMGKES